MTESSKPAPAIQGIVPEPLTASEARKAERAASTIGAARLHALMSQRLSPVRIAAFEDSGPRADNSPASVVARYWYSVAFAEALVLALHLLEVTLRNAVYGAVATRLGGSKGTDIPDCWLDASKTDTVLYQNPRQPWRDDYQKVQAAKNEITRDRRGLEAGRLIAELNFGFWTGLFAGHYGQREGEADSRKFWPVLLLAAFPYLPPDSLSRAAVAERLNQLRKLRNRVFHHEPLWRRKPVADLATICETIGWVDPTIAELAKVMSSAKQLQELGVIGYEARVRAFALKHFPLSRPPEHSGPEL